MDAKRKLISYFYDGSLIVTCTGERRFGSFPACVELMNRFTTGEALTWFCTKNLSVWELV